jgi:hypothetical protein
VYSILFASSGCHRSTISRSSSSPTAGRRGCAARRRNSASSGATKFCFSTCCFRCDCRRSSSSTRIRCASGVGFVLKRLLSAPLCYLVFFSRVLVRHQFLFHFSISFFSLLSFLRFCSFSIRLPITHTYILLFHSYTRFCFSPSPPLLSQVVRGDLKELVDMDLQGAPYAYTPFCDSNKAVEGFRFWKQGFWRDHLQV